MELEEDKSIDLFNALSILKMDLIKECYEISGINLGKTEIKAKFKNYLISEPLAIAGYTPGAGDGNVDDVGAPMLSSGKVKQNAMKVIESLMKILGLTKEQAAGIAGVLTSESQVNPHIVNKDEKNGTYPKSSANNLGTPYGTKNSPWSYGAGICQWTFCNRKENAIMAGLGCTREKAKSIILHGGIESLSLEDQIKMLAGELKTTYKNTLIGIKKCTTAEMAAATYYCHSVAGWSSSTEPATQAEINKMNAKYSTVGAVSQITKGMKYAKGYVS